MAYSLTWLPDVLRKAGLKVIEQPNWQTRGHGDVKRIIGVVCHHIAGAGPKAGAISKDDLATVTFGRHDLSGPLSNLALDRDGVFYIVAAGKAWHAGKGSWKGCTDGNSHFIGIEAAQTGWISGAKAELWEADQIDAYARGCAAILDYIRHQPVTQCIGHREWAPHRKTDPSFNMDQFRDGVAFYMKNPAGTWTGALDRMAARLSVPKHCYDGCGDVSLGEMGKVVLPLSSTM